MALQPTARQPQDLDWRTNAGHGNWAKGRWTSWRITCASRMKRDFHFPYRTKQTCQSDKTTGQPRQTNNKRIQGQANVQKIREGRGKSRWRVCVYWWGRQHSAILSHLSWLTTGTAPKHTNKTRREARKHQTNNNKRPGKQIKKSTKRLSCGPW